MSVRRCWAILVVVLLSVAGCASGGGGGGAVAGSGLVRLWSPQFENWRQGRLVSVPVQRDGIVSSECWAVAFAAETHMLRGTDRVQVQREGEAGLEWVDLDVARLVGRTSCGG